MNLFKQIFIVLLSASARILKLVFGILSFNKKGEITLDIRGLLWLFVLISGLHYLVYVPLSSDGRIFSNGKQLYLLNYAGNYVDDLDGFEYKVRDVSKSLEIPPEWLMAVMYSESKFNASVENHKGSGATGLIQFMPETARDFGISAEELRNMGHKNQLNIVYEYLNRVKNKYGEYNSLTDLYLAILYPKALSGDYCFTLYAEPSAMYSQNSGLDRDKDGRVTVKDIDKYLQHRFPSAYVRMKSGEIAANQDVAANINKAGISN